jgi:hypothetical protein
MKHMKAAFGAIHYNVNAEDIETNNNINNSNFKNTQSKRSAAAYARTNLAAVAPSSVRGLADSQRGFGYAIACSLSFHECSYTHYCQTGLQLTILAGCLQDGIVRLPRTERNTS